MAVKYKVFVLGTIAASGGELAGELDITDAQAKTITGFVLSSENLPQLLNRGEIRLDKDGVELLPDGFDARAVALGGMNVAPNSRFFSKLGPLEIGSGKLRYRYLDVNSPALVFASYRVKLKIEYSYE